jgi:Ser/Thr protein kinase RdoA (MazF antagonist)
MQPLTALVETIGRAYGLQALGQAQAVGLRVWRLPTACGDVAIKLFAADQRAMASKEAGLLAHLATHIDSRFRVQRLLSTMDGETLLATPGNYALLTRWDAGTFKSYDRFSPDEWRALGRSLAALHLSLDDVRQPAVETLSSRLYAIDVDDERHRIAQDRVRLPANASLDAQSLRDYLDTCLRMIDRYYPGSVEGFPGDDPQHPIHNDYNQFNYLFGDTLPPLILDWEASIGAPREFEVVRCLNHLPLESPSLARIFVQAYMQVRPLHTERMAWAVDTAGLMHALKHWLLRGWLDDPSCFETRLQGALRIAAILADARERLVDFYTYSVEAGG